MVGGDEKEISEEVSDANGESTGQPRLAVNPLNAKLTKKGSDTMQTLKRFSTVAAASLAGLAILASLILVGPLRAEMKGMSSSPMPMGGQGMMGMMGPMQMTGVVTMNGKPYNMQCSMKPVGKRRSGRMMGGMNMNGPMKMTGTMTMMGQKYRCDMEMTPRSAPTGQ